jgi:hypothetical protein
MGKNPSDRKSPILDNDQNALVQTFMMPGRQLAELILSGIVRHSEIAKGRRRRPVSHQTWNVLAYVPSAQIV